MYHQISATELFHERQIALLEEAEDRRLVRQLHSGPRPKPKGVAAAPPLGFLVVLLIVAGIMLLGPSSPAHAATTFTVNSTGNENDLDFTNGVFDGSSDGTCDVDSGQAGNQCTLRAAIEEANLTTAKDTIRFNIPGRGVHTISVSSQLPNITQPLTIDGYTQPGSSVNTSPRGTNAKLLIELKPSATNTVLRGLQILASNTVVKGLVIGGFGTGSGGQGIEISPSTGVLTNVRIEGNFIGTDPSGTIAHGNDAGVDLFATSNSTVGGTSLASRNLISGNTFDGVFIEGAGFSGWGNAEKNKVQGNLIGTKRDGITPLGNGRSGVTVYEDGPDTATGNSILSNTMFSNDGLGIDLAGDGVNLNDVDDPSTPQPDPDTDSGPNTFQNFPDITSATTSRRATTIKGTFNSTPNTTFTLQFFSSPQPDASHFGEGQRFKVQKSVTTDDAGDASFNLKLERGKKIAVGQFVTSTATDPKGNTSEFSGATEVLSL